MANIRTANTRHKRAVALQARNKTAEKAPVTEAKPAKVALKS